MLRPIKVVTDEFWDKSYTKQWLENNTTFKFPSTITPVTVFREALSNLDTVPLGSWVWKPNTGRQSKGVILFEHVPEGFKLFHTEKLLTLDNLRHEIISIVNPRKLGRKGMKEHKYWFVEEWIKPHKQLYPFTDNIKCPPILRFCGCPDIHFIGLSVFMPEHTGISACGWKDRKYIWLDLKGKIRLHSDMNLSQVDAHSIEVVKSKSLENPPVGVVLEGISQVVKQLNDEIAPKIILYNNLSWSCDGTFDEKGDFIVVEMNHSPGTQFRGFQWK